MRRVKLAVVITTVMLFCSLSNLYGQANATNRGTEFWTAYMDHEDGAGSGFGRGSQMELYITSDVNTSGQVAVADGSFSQSFSVTANQVTIITIPPSAFLDTEGQFLKGIHITSLKPVAIYAHIFASAVSGATLLLPVNSLGKDYYSINYTQGSNSETDEGLPSFSTFMVIATQDNTTVEITPSQSLTSGKSANVAFILHLKKGELYQGLSTNDLSGTRIRSLSTAAGSCTKIAVFSGSTKIAIGCGTTDATSDNLFQQVYPTASWGKNYVTVPLAERQYDVFRIIFSDPSTTATLNGIAIPSNNFYYEFDSNTPNIISADKPIQVVQYAVSQGKSMNCSFSHGDVGDPEMIYLTPIEQTLDHVTLYSTTNFNILKEFINVVIKTAAAPTFTLDGSPYTTFTPLAGNPQYAYAQIKVTSGTHIIKAADGFNAIAYGFGIDESYGYAAGTNLQNLNEFIALNNPLADTVQINGCSGVSYKLQLTLPYQTTNIKWDFKDGSTPYTDSNPVPTSTKLRGTQMLYIYQYPKPAKSYSSGDYSVVATVFDPLADACGSNEDIELDFNIADPPDAKFNITSTCIGDSTLFTDVSDAKGSNIKTWAWSFGDGKTSAFQNPKHVFTTPGDYTVTLTVTNENGCTSSPVTQTLHIASKPVAIFSVSNPDCPGQLITLTDKSTTVNGTITKWIWNFGDSSVIDTLLNNNPVMHSFADTGNYTIKLNVVLSSGCISNTDSVVVHLSPLPVVNFTLPAVCLSDAYAQFASTSSIADHTESSFTYLWDFGDPNATAANPNTSTSANPKHKYSQVRDSTNPYQVKLTVTSKNGCSFSKTQSFTVNGDTPVAGFTVENGSMLCSNSPVLFDDHSSVNFGNVTKIVWYFDYSNHPTDTVVFLKDSMPASRIYNHKYNIFSAPATQSFTVRLDAYSGQSCVNSYIQVVTLLARPVIGLTAVDSICQFVQPVQIIENKQGFAGAGVFAGSGVSPTGLFDPNAANPGNVVIKYSFAAQNGCVFDTSLVIKVIAAPTVSITPTITMLEGGSVTLNPQATGNGLTYKWYPSIGLNHDDIVAPVASPVEDIDYKLVVTSSQGCSASADIKVHVLKFPTVPNTFTPNGDGINDYWDIKYLNSYPNNTVDVYNRYGEKVYSSIGYGTPWDGRYKGTDLPSGTYYYIINPRNGRKVISGNVTIIR